MATNLSPHPRVSHFEIVSEIGRGGMGAVYQARDLNLGRDVALKCPLPENASDAAYRRRFLREARAAASLAHAHIVSVYEVFEAQGGPWIAMELVEGGDLRGRLASGQPLHLEELLKHAIGLADALSTAHRHHLLHRDIKPSNVLLSKDGRARLTDFGLARPYVPPEGDSSLSTASSQGEEGRFAGTPGYMAPEQALGRPVDPRSDIFSFGVLLYEMATGRPAFPPTDDGSTLDAVLHREPVAISRLNYAIPGEMERIIRKCLAKEPDERYQSAAELLSDLRTFHRHGSAGVGTGAAVAGPVIGASKGGWLSRPFLMVTLVGTLAAAAGIALYLGRGHKEAPPAPAGTPRIAILAPRSLLDEKIPEDWPEIFQALLADELTGVPGFAVVDPLSLRTRAGASLAPDVAEAEIRARVTRQGASWIVDGSIVPAGSAYEIRMRLGNLKTGVMGSSFKASVGQASDLPAAASAMALEILGSLDAGGAARPDRSLRPWIGARRRNVAAVKAFLQASRYIHRTDPQGRHFLERALELDPEFVAPRVWLVASLVGEGDREAARKHQAILMQIEPKASPFEQAMIGWAGTFIDGNVEAQKTHLEVALGYSPGNNILLINLAWIHASQDDCEGAIRAMEGPIGERWDYPDLYPLWGWCNVMEGRVDAARDGLLVSHQLGDPDARVYALLEAIAHFAGNREDAGRWSKLRAERGAQLGTKIVPSEIAPIYLKLAELSRAQGRGTVAAELEDLARPEPESTKDPSGERENP